MQYYLTKPIDEDELEEILRSIKENLDKDAATANTREHYREKARETIIRDLLTNDIDLSHINTTDLHLTADTYQVVDWRTAGCGSTGDGTCSGKSRNTA